MEITIRLLLMVYFVMRLIDGAHSWPEFVSITGSNYRSAFATLVKRINFYRSIFGSPSCASNPTLNIYAQSRAYLYASSGRFGVPKSIFNESIYFNCANDVSDITQHATAAVISWFTQQQLYNYSNPGYQPDASDFIQLIWKNVTNIGFGCTVRNFAGGRQCVYITCVFNGTNIKKPDAKAFMANVPAPIIF